VGYQHKEKIAKCWESAIRCCVSSPTLDVVVVGCFDGTVHVHKM
jgi:U3 small nucleolar RNA-associated protein 21